MFRRDIRAHSRTYLPKTTLSPVCTHDNRATKTESFCFSRALAALSLNPIQLSASHRDIASQSFNWRQNMIDPSSEQLIDLKKASHLRTLKINGVGPHITQLYRWASRGVRGRKLDTLLVGGRTVTSVEAVLRFLQPVEPAVRSPRRATRRSAGALSELRKSGWANSRTR